MCVVVWRFAEYTCCCLGGTSGVYSSLYVLFVDDVPCITQGAHLTGPTLTTDTKQLHL